MENENSTPPLLPANPSQEAKSFRVELPDATRLMGEDVTRIARPHPPLISIPPQNLGRNAAVTMEENARTRQARNRRGPDESFDFDMGETVRSLVCETTLFNRFKTKRILGRGGMGVVWLAEDMKLRRDVALKFMPEVVAMDAVALNDLRKETRLGILLSHHNVVQMLDLVEDGPSAAIVMEYVDGATIAALRLEQPDEAFSVSSLKPIVDQLLNALQYAHSSVKLVHRDLKPANLMVNKNGQLKIADFGIASCVRDSVSRVSLRASTTAGTLVYVSPQQRMGEVPKFSDDIYSLGATLYELLTGRPPFYTGDIGVQVATSIPPLVSERRKEFGIHGEPIPKAWDEVIAACLEKDPRDRPADIAAIKDGLNGLKFMHGSGKLHQHQPTKTLRQPQQSGHAKLPVWVWPAAACGAVVLALSAWHFGVRIPEEERRSKTLAEETQRKRNAETERLAAEQRRKAADESLAEHKREIEDASLREVSVPTTLGKKALWTPVQANLAEYDYPYGDDELSLRAEVSQKISTLQEKENTERTAYQAQLLKMQTEFKALQELSARPDLGAGPKQVKWGEFANTWGNAPFPPGYGTEHEEIRISALAQNTKWGAEKEKETPAAPVGYPQCFADSAVASWNAQGKKAALTAVQDSLITAGLFKAKQPDGIYSPALHVAVLDFQRGKDLPVNGRLDQYTLKSMQIPTDQPPNWGVDNSTHSTSADVATGGVKLPKPKTGNSGGGGGSNAGQASSGDNRTWWDKYGAPAVRGTSVYSPGYVRPAVRVPVPVPGHSLPIPGRGNPFSGGLPFPGHGGFPLPFR